MTTYFDAAETAKDLRKLAGEIIPDDDELTLAQSVADYLDSTQPLGRASERIVFAEIAFAYIEGYAHATGEHPREVYKALRAVGLSI